MEADGQDRQRRAKSAVHLLKSFSRPTVVSLSCMVNEMSSGMALGEREPHLIVAVGLVPNPTLQDASVVPRNTEAFPES